MSIDVLALISPKIYFNSTVRAMAAVPCSSGGSFATNF